MDKETPTSVDIVFPEPMWHSARNFLLNIDSGSDLEQLVFVLCNRTRADGTDRLIASELVFAGEEDFDYQAPAGLNPRAEFVAHALSRCRQDGFSLLEIHSHPFDHSGRTTFSGIDMRCDVRKMPAITSALPPDCIHATMVVGHGSFDAHYYDRNTTNLMPIRQLVVVGGSGANFGRSVQFPVTDRSRGRGGVGSETERYSRQAPLIGRGGQSRLRNAHVAVVGAGGLGSFVATELAYYGIGELTLVDHDRVEESNLNRLLGTGPEDSGSLKVEVLAREVRRVAPETKVNEVPNNLCDPGVIESMAAADVVVGCVDNHGARLLLSQMSVQYVIPLVDSGTGAREHAGDWQVGGQVQVVMPGLGCLECRGAIDASRAAYDLGSEQSRAFDDAGGYGTGAPAPSVVSLNGVVGSMAAQVVVSLLSADRTQSAPIVMFDAIRQTMQPVSFSAGDTCVSCGVDGIFALGHSRAVYVEAEDITPSFPSRQRG